MNYALEGRFYENRLKVLELLHTQAISRISEKIDAHLATIENSTQIPLIAKELIKATDQNSTTTEIDPLIAQHIKKIVIKHDIYDFFLITKEGQIVYTFKKEGDLGKNLNSKELRNTPLSRAFQESAHTLDTVLTDIEYYEPSKKEGAFTVAPIIDKGELLGFVALQMDKNFIFSLIKSEAGLGKSGEIVAGRAMQNGDIIPAIPLKYDKEAFDKKRVLNKNNLATGLEKAVLGESGKGDIIDYRGVETLAVWGYEPNMKWGIISKIDKDEVLSSVREQTKILLIMLIGSIFLALLFTVWLSKTITRPIKSLVTSMEEFKDDFDRRASVEASNEIGFLAQEFNNMADDISKQINLLQEQAATLEEQAAEIAEHNFTLEERVKYRTEELLEAKESLDRYINIVDRYVIASSTDADGFITYASEAFCKISGYSKSELIGKTHSILRDPAMPKELFEDLWKTIKSGKDWSGEICNISKKGDRYWVKAHISPVYDEENNIASYTAIREDITDKKIIEELAITDRLTQVYNRIQLDRVLQSEIVKSNRYKTPFSVILLDIDKFKSVNDTYGHQVGDSVLKESASLLKSSIRDSDTLGRWGGEEFLIITPNSDLESSKELAEKLRKAMEDFCFTTVGQKTGSFGVSTYKEGDNEESILKRADDALYRAKEGGRNRVETQE